MTGVSASEFACARLNALVDSNFQNATYEVKRRLGPGGSVHQDIVEKGDGRFSVWHGGVYFSLPGSLAISSVTRLELRAPIVSQFVVAKIISALRYLSAIGLVAWIFVRLTGPRLGFLYRNVLPGLIISAVLLAAGLYGADRYFRHAGMFPITDGRWPTQFVDQVGFLFIPGDTVRFTNGTEFWASEKVNSLGFLDREPVLPKPPGMFRIALVGDSFVEAAQVAIAQKLQTLAGGKSQPAISRPQIRCRRTRFLRHRTGQPATLLRTQPRSQARSRDPAFRVERLRQQLARAGQRALWLASRSYAARLHARATGSGVRSATDRSSLEKIAPVRRSGGAGAPIARHVAAARQRPARHAFQGRSEGNLSRARTAAAGIRGCGRVNEMRVCRVAEACRTGRLQAAGGVGRQCRRSNRQAESASRANSSCR